MLPGLLLFLLLAALALAFRLFRRLRAAEARLTEAEARAAGQSRSLGLLVHELEGPGLSLLAVPGAQAEARRLLRLADEAKDLLAAAAGPRALREEAVPLLPVLQDAVEATAALLGPGRRQWRLAPEFEGLILRADRRALQGALQQVLARSARETRDADWIDLRPVLTPETLAIVVEDEGAGRGAADLTSEAAAAAAAQRTRGLSFGLAVARSLLEAHGGSLRLEAQPGIGARAWLTLPRERVLA